MVPPSSTTLLLLLAPMLLALLLLATTPGARARPNCRQQLFVAPLRVHRLGPRAQIRTASAPAAAMLRVGPRVMAAAAAEAETDAGGAVEAETKPFIHRQHSIGSITPAGAFAAETASEEPPAAALNASSSAAAVNAASATTSSGAGTAALEARVKQLEETIKTLEKALKRLELGGSGGAGAKVKGKAVGGIWDSWRSKTVVINYDVGPDATIDSIDIACAAAGAFGLLGMLVARSLARNLWLVGGIASAVLAGSLAREEEGGALSDVVRAVGFEVALKARQLAFMYRTGRLSYAYFKKWEELDRRYQLHRKLDAVKALSLKKWREAEEAERKYQLRFRLTSALKAAYDGAIDTTASLFNAKDRRELVKKLPKPLRYLFMSKAQRRLEERRRVRVTKFVGLREGRPIVEVDDED